MTVRIILFFLSFFFVTIFGNAENYSLNDFRKSQGGRISHVDYVNWVWAEKDSWTNDENKKEEVNKALLYVNSHAGINVDPREQAFKDARKSGDYRNYFTVAQRKFLGSLAYVVGIPLKDLALLNNESDKTRKAERFNLLIKLVHFKLEKFCLEARQERKKLGQLDQKFMIHLRNIFWSVFFMLTPKPDLPSTITRLKTAIQDPTVKSFKVMEGIEIDHNLFDKAHDFLPALGVSINKTDFDLYIQGWDRVNNSNNQEQLAAYITQLRAISFFSELDPHLLPEKEYENIESKIQQYVLTPGKDFSPFIEQLKKLQFVYENTKEALSSGVLAATASSMPEEPKHLPKYLKLFSKDRLKDYIGLIEMITQKFLNESNGYSLKSLRNLEEYILKGLNEKDEDLENVDTYFSKLNLINFLNQFFSVENKEKDKKKPGYLSLTMFLGKMQAGEFSH